MEGKKKEYLNIRSGSGEISVLGSAVLAFASCLSIGKIIISVKKGDEETARSYLPLKLKEDRKRIIFCAGGQSRRSSVHKALLCLEEYKPTHVLIHDGARPWIKKSLIEQIIDGTLQHEAVIPVLPLIETPKKLESVESGFIKTHLKRENLCTAQTPQGFKFPEILMAHEKAARKEEQELAEYTDDAEIWGEFVGKVKVIEGDPLNRKITYPGDLI